MGCYYKCTYVVRNDPLFLSDCNETLIFSTDFRKILKHQISRKSVQWEPSYSTWMDGQTTDRHDKANSRFMQLRTHLETDGTVNPIHATKTCGEAGVQPHIFLVLCYLEVAVRCFSTAGPRPGTGPWHQLNRAAKGSPGICHFSFLSNFHE